MKKRIFAFSIFLLSLCLGISLTYVSSDKFRQRQISRKSGAPDSYRIYTTEIQWFGSFESADLYTMHGMTNIAVFYRGGKFITGNCMVSYHRIEEHSRTSLSHCELYDGNWERDSKGGIETSARHSVDLSANTRGGRYMLPFGNDPPPTDHITWQPAEGNRVSKPVKEDNFGSLPNIIKTEKTPFSDTPQKYVRVVEGLDDSLLTQKLKKL